MVPLPHTTPSTASEKEIAEKADEKGKTIREGTGRWDDNIIQAMRIAVGFVMTEAALGFFER